MEALVVVGSAVCGADMGMSTLTWTVTNSTQSVLSVSDERGVFDGVEVAVGESVSRIQLIRGPAQATVIDNAFTGVAEGESFEAEDPIEVAPCVAPPQPGGALVASAGVVCAAAESTLTWSLRNDTALALTVEGSNGLFTPGVTVEPGATVTDTEVLARPATETAVARTFWGYAAGWAAYYDAQAAITVPVCPAAPPPVEALVVVGSAVWGLIWGCRR